MALATQCPHCKTTFRVAQDQLKLRGGIVRCGACHEIFDGNASLVDLDAAPAPSPSPFVEPQAEAAVEVHEAEATPPADQGDVPVFTLDLGHALDPLGILPKPEGEQPPEHEAATPSAADVAGQAEPEAIITGGEVAFEDDPAEPAAVEPPAAPSGEAEPDLEAAPVHEAAAQPDHEAAPEPAFEAVPEAVHEAPLAATHDGRVEPSLHVAGEPQSFAIDAESGPHSGFAHGAVEHAPLPQRASSDAGANAAPPEPPKSARARQQARRSKLTPTRIAPPKLRVPEIDEPEFVKRGRQREQTGKRRVVLMSIGAAVLLLALLAQAAYIFRSDLAVRAPAMRPALSAMCSLLRCRVELPARIDNLTIEQGELQTQNPDTYVLTTLLRNQGGTAQAWPDIELALTDANDKPLVRRVFAPSEYLPKDAAGAGFAPHGEQPVKLYFQLDQLKPSGYHIAVFYP